VPLKQKSAHCSLCFQAPSVEQSSSTWLPSGAQRFASGTHSRHFPVTHAGVVAGQVTSSQTPFWHSRAVEAEVHS
jgi:hypothetical protein